MSRLFKREIDVKTISPVTLAFVGDGVYDLMVREMLVCRANRPSGDLHLLKVDIVRAEAQAAAVHNIMGSLSEEEQKIFRRGRNAKTSRKGKDYHTSTGFEAVFGYLYLNGETERIREIFDIIHQEKDS